MSGPRNEHNLCETKGVSTSLRCILLLRNVARFRLSTNDPVCTSEGFVDGTEQCGLMSSCTHCS